MTDTNPSTLSELHELPWSDIAGAHVVVDTVDYPPHESNHDPDEERSNHERREGDLVGRAIGSGLRYDNRRGETVADQIGPAIFLNTPDDTVLEVSTEKSGNELLLFEMESDTDNAE